MTPRAAVFAIPGDIETVTGGYIYERRLLLELRARGHDVQHLQLAASFPDPSPHDMAGAIAALADIEPARVLILDGLVYGSIDTAGLARVRAPIVAMIHHPLALETGLTPARRQHLFKTERDNLALAARVLVPSRHTAAILAADYSVPPGRITIAPPGTDPLSATRMPTDPPLILSVGIQHPRKGHDILLRALAETVHLNWQAIIVGSNYDHAHAAGLRRLLNQLGLAHRVTFAGRIPQDKLEELYGTATVFALATRYEGYGMVFDEALSWGLPIVSCDTGAVAQTVPADAGILVPPEDPAALAEALRHVLSDRAARTKMEAAASRAGQALPRWQDTAGIAGDVLDRLGHQVGV